METAGSGERRPVRVTILSQTFTLLTAGDPVETEQLAARVNDLMSTIASRAGNIDATQVAVLASLHLADELRSLERELEALRDRVAAKSREFSLLLDQVVAGNDSTAASSSNAGTPTDKAPAAETKSASSK